MYSLISLLSGIYPLPAMHPLLVTLYVTEYVIDINQRWQPCHILRLLIWKRNIRHSLGNQLSNWVSQLIKLIRFWVKNYSKTSKFYGIKRNCNPNKNPQKKSLIQYFTFVTVKYGQVVSQIASHLFDIIFIFCIVQPPPPSPTRRIFTHNFSSCSKNYHTCFLNCLDCAV